MTKKSVFGVIFSADRSKVLITKRRDVPIWVLPGGGIDDEETPEDALGREIKEETGLNVVISRKVAEYFPLNSLSKYTYFFECKVVGGELGCSDETCDVGFFAHDALPYPFLPIYIDWISDALSNSPEVIKKPVLGASWMNFIRYAVTHPILVFRFILSRLGIPLNT